MFPMLCFHGETAAALLTGVGRPKLVAMREATTAWRNSMMDVYQDRLMVVWINELTIESGDDFFEYSRPLRWKMWRRRFRTRF